MPFGCSTSTPGAGGVIHDRGRDPVETVGRLAGQAGERPRPHATLAGVSDQIDTNTAYDGGAVDDGEVEIAPHFRRVSHGEADERWAGFHPTDANPLDLGRIVGATLRDRGYPSP